MQRKTIITICGRYRYVLWREWDVTNRNYAMFIGLNPSTADAIEDDPTIRRCVAFAKSWNYGALCMVNLFALRATQPELMKAHHDPIGRDNDRWLAKLGKNAGVIVAAWGVSGIHLQRDQVVMRLFAQKLTCLALTKGGHPRHPLYLKRTLKPVAFA